VQHYAYTAYGRAIGFNEAAALTTLLYSGEAFDSRRPSHVPMPY
jgi:hypothetical protein